MSIIVALLVLGSIWRVARLVAVDEISRVPRGWIARRGDTWGYFITCPWCVSIWMAPGLAALPIYFPSNRGVLIALLALSGSLTAGLGQSIEDRLDR